MSSTLQGATPFPGLSRSSGDSEACVRNENGDITRDNTETQRIIRDYYEQSYVNKLYNLEEMGKFLEAYNFPRMNHEEIKI